MSFVELQEKHPWVTDFRMKNTIKSLLGQCEGIHTNLLMVCLHHLEEEGYINTKHGQLLITDKGCKFRRWLDENVPGFRKVS